MMVLEPWAMGLVLLAEFFLLVMLGGALMTLVRWESRLREQAPALKRRLRDVAGQTRRVKRQVLAVEAAAIPDAGTLLSPLAIATLLLRWRRKSRRA